MAIPYWTLKTVSRKSDKSALRNAAYISGKPAPMHVTGASKGTLYGNPVANSAYISGSKIEDWRNGKYFSYGREERVLKDEILLPENTPEWMQELRDHEKLWNTVNEVEVGERATTHHRIIFAIPKEFSKREGLRYAQRYAQMWANKGHAVEYAIHIDGPSWNKSNNPHVHVLIADRPLNLNAEKSHDLKDAFAKKKQVALYSCKSSQGHYKLLSGERFNELKRDQNNMERWDKLYCYFDPKKIVRRADGRVDFTKSGGYEKLTKKEGDERGWIRSSRQPINYKESAFFNGVSPRAAMYAHRFEWQKITNQCLKDWGYDTYIDMRSYAEQGKWKFAQKHIGSRDMRWREQVKNYALRNKLSYSAAELALKNKNMHYNNCISRLNKNISKSLNKFSNVRYTTAKVTLNKLVYSSNDGKRKSEQEKAAQQMCEIVAQLIGVTTKVVFAIFDRNAFFNDVTVVPQITLEQDKFEHRELVLNTIEGESQELIKQAEEIRQAVLRSFPIEKMRDDDFYKHLEDEFNSRDAETWIRQKDTAERIIKAELVSSKQVDGKAKLDQVSQEKPFKGRAKLIRDNCIASLKEGIPEKYLNNEAYILDMQAQLSAFDGRFWEDNENHIVQSVLSLECPDLTCKFLDKAKISKPVQIGLYSYTKDIDKHFHATIKDSVFEQELETLRFELEEAREACEWTRANTVLEKISNVKAKGKAFGTYKEKESNKNDSKEDEIYQYMQSQEEHKEMAHSVDRGGRE